MTVTLRPFTEADVAFAAALLQIPEVERWWNRHDEAKVREEMIEDPDAHYSVIERDGEPVGIIGWYEEDDPDYRHAGMDISVHPSVFGAGVAVEALRQTCRFLIEERGHHRLIIDPNAANERAIACYRKVGFRPVGVMRRYERNLHGEWTDGLLMDMLADELT
jgi:aminoglycoside 6'-N-acetyltransferase